MARNSSLAEVLEPVTSETSTSTQEAVAQEVRRGLALPQKELSPWLFYDVRGSELFEEITGLDEYYLTRTERALFERHGAEIARWLGDPLTVVELGAGTAAKTGILLRAIAQHQGELRYEPIDISPSALEAAEYSLNSIIGLTVAPHVANYITEAIRVDRIPGTRILALYIGSSIGNFSPQQARAILRNLRDTMQPGDGLLLGTDLAPNAHKPLETVLAAYNDAPGINDAFNRNLLTRLNRELGADFRLDRFTHLACWNAAHSRIEMHLRSTCSQTVHLPANAAGDALQIHFTPGETIHTENSYKFTPNSIAALLNDTGSTTAQRYTDPDCLFAVTLAKAV